MARGEAQSGMNLFSSSQAITTGITKIGNSTAEWTVATTNGKMTPASIAEEICGGIFATSLPSAGHRPVKRISKEETKKAPTAVSKLKPKAPLEARNAAPGVDQTMLTGILR
jgi:hypothetical protein